MDKFDLGDALASVLFWGFVALGGYAIGQAIGFTAFMILMVCLVILYNSDASRA